jgi:hypothetical protein
MVELILTIISESLPIIDKALPDQATKIRNEILELRKQWDAEISKGSSRNDAFLDSLELRIGDICQLYIAAAQQTASKN